MRLKSLTFENWLCFAGRHELQLDAKAYAIVARHVRNVRRSNWLGKSGTAEALRFLITGWHRHRTEDEWITDGEKAGGVHAVFEDGTTVSRTRKRGQSTRLSVSGATQELAQQRIYELLGLTEQDFLATSFFEQGKMSRFITQEASDRTAIVIGWFRLDPLIAAEEIHKNQLAKLTWSATTTREQLHATDEMERAELAGFENFDQLVETKTKLTGDIKKMRETLASAKTLIEQAQLIATNEERKKQFEEICKRGIEMKELIDGVDIEEVQARRERAQDELNQITGERGAAQKDLVQKRQLATGTFGGTCPIANIPCPAKNDINKRRTQNEKLAESAQGVLDGLTKRETEARKKFTNADASMQSYERVVSQMDALRDQGIALKDQIDDDLIASTKDIPKDIDRLNTKLQDSIAKLAVYERSIAAIEKSRGERLRLAQLLSGLESAITTEREAKAIVGRNGAQRRIAEDGLKEIEDGANTMLSESGIDLRVAMRWSREGTQLASACEECGHPFPKTAKAKICERCEAPRGMNIINKLEPVLSNTSGAAKDLAGVAFQLSASAWMRQHRGSRWSVALLDEPFGQLDEENRKALSTHLATLLRSRYGFEQSFTIAHHTGVLDALPGRIEIVGDGTHSTIKVVT